MFGANVWTMLAQQFPVMIGLLIVLETCEGNLVVGPTDVSTEVNRTVTLECISNANTFVKWKHCLVDGSKCNIINYKKSLEAQYSVRFSLSKRCASGNCTLTIRDVQPRDVGEYCCVDKDGVGEMNCSQLTIITDIQCWNDAPDGAISGTSCGIPPDRVQHTCRVHYEGRTPPSIVWTDEAGNAIHDSHQRVENKANIVTSKIIQEAAASKSESVVRCRVKSSDVSCASKYHSYYAYNSSDRITLSDGSITCNVISSEPCNLTWHLTGNADFSESNPILNFSSGSFTRGEYVCSASCNLKSKSCRVRGSTVKFDPTAKRDCSDGISKFQYVATIVVLVMIIALVFVYTCYFHGRNKKIWGYSAVQQKDLIPTEEDEIVADDLKLDSVNTTNRPIAMFENTLYGKVKVRGMTVIHNVMYIICNRSKSVEKYDLEKNEKLVPLVVPQLESPWSLAKCINNRYIHISEYDNSEEAHIFTITVDLGVIRRWPVSKEFCRNWVRISVTKANNNLVVCGRMSSKIEVYSYDQHETRLSVIDLESNVTDMQQAIQLGKNSVIFIHGFSDDKNHRICRKNSSKKFEEIGEHGIKSLSTPTDVVASSKGRIYVADYYNDRVLIFNSDLQLENEVNLDAHPSRLFIDDQEEFLYIGGAPGSILRWPILRP